MRGQNSTHGASSTSYRLGQSGEAGLEGDFTTTELTTGSFKLFHSSSVMECSCCRLSLRAYKDTRDKASSTSAGRRTQLSTTHLQ